MNDSHEEILVVTRHDPAREDDVDFVNYTPANLLNPQHRRAVTSFVNSVKKRKPRLAKPGPVRHSDTGTSMTKTTGRTLVQPVHASPRRRTGRGPPRRDLGYFIGGLRTDPFNSYPVPARDPVTNAVDVYCQIWAPTHIEQFLPGAHSNFLLSELFPLALQQTGLFDALVAWSLCFSSTYYKRDTFLTKEVLYHRGNAIGQLRTHLMPSSKFSSDAAIMTLVFLMGVEYLTGDIATSDTLLQAIYQLVEYAGGLDKLGLKGIAKAMILRIEKEWTRRRNQKSRYTVIALTEYLEYPTHPFPSELCNSIAKMPPGFRDLALEAVLSIQTLQILERMSAWHTRAEHAHRQVATPEEIGLLEAHQPQVDAEEAYRCLDILMSLGAEGIERCLFYGLITYSLEVFAHKKFNPELYWIMQDLPLALEQLVPQPRDMDCLIWVSMVAVEACKGSLSQKGNEIIDKLLRNHPRLREWDAMEQTLRTFFWLDSLAVAWKRSWNAAVTRRTLAQDQVTDPWMLAEPIRPEQFELPYSKGHPEPSR